VRIRQCHNDASALAPAAGHMPVMISLRLESCHVILINLSTLDPHDSTRHAVTTRTFHSERTRSCSSHRYSDAVYPLYSPTAQHKGLSRCLSSRRRIICYIDSANKSSRLRNAGPSTPIVLAHRIRNSPALAQPFPSLLYMTTTKGN
jgi:hypothetical protein